MAKIESNIKVVQAVFDQLAAEMMTAPIESVVYNDVPYIRWLEHGGMKLYDKAANAGTQKSKRNVRIPKSVQKVGDNKMMFRYYVRTNIRPVKERKTVSLPKGGKSVRKAWSTLLVQYPYGMVAKSTPNIENYGVRRAASIKVFDRGSFVKLSNQIARYSRQQFMFKTPRGKTQKAVKGWGIRSAK